MEPVTTLTATAIANLAFQEFIKSGAGELAKKFTAEASDLRKLLWERLRGKHAIAEAALQKAETGDRDSIDTVGTLLGVEMLDPTFAAEVRSIAHVINAGKLAEHSNINMILNNYDNARGWQTRVEGGTTYIGEIHQHSTPKAESYSRQEILLSVIENTPEADLPKLLNLVQNFHQNNSIAPASPLEQIDTSQVKWQQAVNAIDRQDKTSIEQKKAKIAQLILALNEDNDIEEQQQTLKVIDSSSGVSI